MRLASHDPICDPILRKCVVRQRCYTVKCVNVHRVNQFSLCMFAVKPIDLRCMVDFVARHVDEKC